MSITETNPGNLCFHLLVRDQIQCSCPVYEPEFFHCFWVTVTYKYDLYWPYTYFYQVLAKTVVNDTVLRKIDGHTHLDRGYQYIGKTSIFANNYISILSWNVYGWWLTVIHFGCFKPYQCRLYLLFYVFITWAVNECNSHMNGNWSVPETVKPRP